MKNTLLFLFLVSPVLVGSLYSQVTVLKTSFDTQIDFWQTPATNDDKSGWVQGYASNSAKWDAAGDAAFHVEYDWVGMLVKFDTSGVSPATVNAPGFQAFLDVQFQGFIADENRYAAYNPDPSGTPGAGDGLVYLDVYPVLESYPSTANRWLKNSTTGSFLNWDDTIPTSLAEARAVGSNFGQSGEIPYPTAVDQTIARSGWDYSEEILAADIGSSARLQWAPGAGPVHLGKAGTFWGADPGNNMDDLGNTIIGDGGANQNFGIVLAFDTTDTFRTKVTNGEPVVLRGTTLFSVDDGLGGVVQKTLGDLGWADLFITVQGYGNSLEGTFGDDPTLGNAFRTASAGNLDPADILSNATYDYMVGPALTFAADPFVEDAEFEIDLTSIVETIALDATVDRIMIGIFARKDGDGTGVGFVGSDGAGDNDRIAFYASSFELAAGNPYPADPTLPNKYGELVWDVTSLVQDWVNGVTPNNGIFLHVNKNLSWGEQVNFNAFEQVLPEAGLINPGDGAPALRLGQAPSVPAVEGVLADPDFNVDVESQPGYYYQLQSSSDGMTSWNDVGDSVEGTGGILQFIRGAPGSGEKVFYRVTASLVP